MASRDDAVQAAQETARFGISTAVEGVATGIIEIGAATPFVAPLCLALLKAKETVDRASRNKKELEELLKRCDLTTEQVINKTKASRTLGIDVSPLRECVSGLTEMAVRYQDQKRPSRLKRIGKSSEDDVEIQRLRARIEAMIPIMGLSVGVTMEKRVAYIESGMRQLTVRLLSLE